MSFNVGDFEDRFKNLIDDILLFAPPFQHLLAFPCSRLNSTPFFRH